ncbi:MAG: Sec-dependent nitrous-oxide reductase, partial [Dehalococcoidia bacterium]|nr:Sec-dependent nitrous-oxide reductase [Dehalococcoidia bacterium]
MRQAALIGLVMLLAGALISCSGDDEDGLNASVSAIAEERGLSETDIEAALKTFVPSGGRDEYLMFASGGHSGQVFVIGIPSMRLLKSIAVFTPEAWQGYGIGGAESEQTLSGGYYNDQEIKWGDTHHPALSETAGDYDGQFLFINEKANGRVGVIDLRDFETKQIVKNPFSNIDHGGTFVTPDTEYIIEGPQYAHPLGGEYAPLSEFNDKYRGYVMFWKFDREAGRIDESQSFGMELPPYWQDLCDVGKKVSAGWLFCGSLNSERDTGGIEAGNPPFEVGASQNDMDYLHVMNWEHAAEVAKSAPKVNGYPLISLDTAVAEDLLFLVPEPKSPHGSDVTPGGEYVIVSGKLDPHITAYSFEKIKAAIDSGVGESDPYGVRILPFDDVMEAQIEVGLGPLHTQFDGDGYAYTSLFLDNGVAKWQMGPPYHDEWKLVEVVPTQYNVGHIAAAEGDTVSPDGRYLVSLNKWATDRFTVVGPLLPQNLQLVDLTGEHMQVIYDMAMGVGEPHYAQIIKADKLAAWEVYPEVGWDPHTQAVDPNAAQPGEERVERNGDTVEIWMTATRSHFNPENIEIQEGDHVIWHITNIERAYDATHGFALSGHNVNLSLEPGESATVEFDAKNSGVFNFYCTEFCSALHLEMTGY